MTTSKRGKPFTVGNKYGEARPPASARHNSESEPTQANQPQSHVSGAGYHRAQEMLLAHLPAALSVLRWEMLHSRTAATRIQAANILAKLGIESAAREHQAAELANLEMLDPAKAALNRLTTFELKVLKHSAMSREEGIALRPDEVAVNKKYAREEQEIRILKLNRLSKCKPVS